MTEFYKPTVWLELPESIATSQLYGLSMGYNGNVYALTIEKVGNRSVINRPYVYFDHPVDYTIHEINEWHHEAYSIPQQKNNFSYVQPLPDDEFLLVCARSQYRGPDDFDLNAHVFTKDGKQQRQFLVGDGVAGVVTDSKGNIWTSYFDEGVIGNFGWGRHPVGEAGLIHWTSTGQQAYAYSPTSGLERILDCYAMNIDLREQIWIYYRMEFPLVNIVDGTISKYWDISVKGASNFTVWKDYALFLGSYDHPNSLTLYQLQENHAELVKRVELPFNHQGACTWDDTLILREDRTLYRVKIADLL